MRGPFLSSLIFTFKVTNTLKRDQNDPVSLVPAMPALS